MEDKIKYEMEFPIQVSPSLLYQYISTPSGLSEWYADNVNSRGEFYTFIWAESEEDKGDHAPMNADYGEFYAWDGNNLEHGNKLNETDETRISFDFRVITKSDYNNRKDKGGSVTSDTKFILGQYYDKIPTFMQRR